MSKIYRYDGTKLTVSWDRQRCIHAEECVHGLRSVFDPDKRPWISPDAAAPNEVAEVVRRCPTGALHYERLDGGEREEPAADNTVTVAADGPLYARGDLVVEVGGESRREVRAAFCRCGASTIKPFCDGSHTELPFEDAGGLGDSRPDEEGEPGPLAVRAAPDGPLLISGRVELVSADGATRRTAVKAALCRCGSSENKPFCDGSHAAIGFRAE